MRVVAGGADPGGLVHWDVWSAGLDAPGYSVGFAAGAAHTTDEGRG
jgi:hypothetical protein